MNITSNGALSLLKQWTFFANFMVLCVLVLLSPTSTNAVEDLKNQALDDVQSTFENAGNLPEARRAIQLLLNWIDRDIPDKPLLDQYASMHLQFLEMQKGQGLSDAYSPKMDDAITLAEELYRIHTKSEMPIPIEQIVQGFNELALQALADPDTNRRLAAVLMTSDGLFDPEFNGSRPLSSIQYLLLGEWIVSYVRDHLQTSPQDFKSAAFAESKPVTPSCGGSKCERQCARSFDRTTTQIGRWAERSLNAAVREFENAVTAAEEELNAIIAAAHAQYESVVTAAGEEYSRQESQIIEVTDQLVDEAEAELNECLENCPPPI